ncbi:GntR family transcriptional regulator [Paenibacillus sp.]|uniref:GntR family transcriptional regulator n=1 Tax=Paenibacillus sp. TaxID=58172 RepID=UPI002D317264|nr:GntR family transcriptional regulator [Paenibacillus sp.]HZG87469.1 GntR family transcriptional regulator [Paenibacillus sp.]
MNFHPLKASRKTLGDDVYKALKEQIVTLQLKPGEMIYESSLASAFGISRTPVREAINRLQQEELIQIYPQRGAIIAHLSEKKVREAQFVRETLEIGAFKTIAGLWDREDETYQKAEKDILSIIVQQKEAVRQGNYIDFIQLDASYHTRILQLVNNQTLMQVLQVMRAHLNRMRYLELREGRHEQESIKHHEMLLEHLKRNEVEKTEQLLITHLRYIVNDWQKIMDKYADFFE